MCKTLFDMYQTNAILFYRVLKKCILLSKGRKELIFQSNLDTI